MIKVITYQAAHGDVGDVLLHRQDEEHAGADGVQESGLDDDAGYARDPRATGSTHEHAHSDVRSVDDEEPPDDGT